jgi:thiosulfate dehydrogenase
MKIMFNKRQIAAAVIGLGVAAGPAMADDAAVAEWSVPDVGSLPDGKYGQAVRYGKSLIEQTYAHIGPEVADPARRFAGNNLACASCHQEAGVKKFAIPLVGVFADFPQYRPREDTIGTIEDRINGCMTRSMNGRKLPFDSAEMKAMTAYVKFVSQGVPVGTRKAGRGTPKLELLDRAADPGRGKVVYAQHCAACHGADGQGVRAGVAGDALGYAFPPLWGPDSYNDGAGMHRVIQAAGFIKHNMPKGVSYDAPVLGDEEAFDVAAFINSQPRPHKEGLENDFPARVNKPVDAASPPFREGFTAAQHKYGPFKPIVAARERDMKAAQ